MESPKPNADLIRPTPRQLRAIGESYGIEPRGPLWDNDISDAAYRLLRRMLSMPATWYYAQGYFASKTISALGFAKVGKQWKLDPSMRVIGVSRRQITRLMNELTAAGYLKKQKMQMKSGRFEWWYTISALTWDQARRAEREELHDKPDNVTEFPGMAVNDE